MSDELMQMTSVFSSHYSSKLLEVLGLTPAFTDLKAVLFN